MIYFACQNTKTITSQIAHTHKIGKILGDVNFMNEFGILMPWKSSRKSINRYQFYSSGNLMAGRCKSFMKLVWAYQASHNDPKVKKIFLVTIIEKE
jgi:hypothetical protein